VSAIVWEILTETGDSGKRVWVLLPLPPTEMGMDGLCIVRVAKEEWCVVYHICRLAGHNIQLRGAQLPVGEQKLDGKTGTGAKSPHVIDLVKVLVISPTSDRTIL
jgi:hypothetical protein